jgi:hypothetical protein
VYKLHKKRIFWPKYQPNWVQSSEIDFISEKWTQFHIFSNHYRLE